MVFFVPAFVSPFIPLSYLKGAVILVDLVYSHLYATSAKKAFFWERV